MSKKAFTQISDGLNDALNAVHNSTGITAGILDAIGENPSHYNKLARIIDAIDMPSLPASPATGEETK